MEAVATAADALMAQIRDGAGPMLLECRTNRIHGHYEGDAQKYRAPDAEPPRDPLLVAAERLLAQGVTRSELEQMAGEVAARIDAAVSAARSAPPASFADARIDVYSSSLREALDG